MSYIPLPIIHGDVQWLCSTTRGQCTNEKFHCEPLGGMGNEHLHVIVGVDGKKSCTTLDEAQ